MSALMSDARRDALAASASTEAVLNKRAFREKHRKKRGRSRGGARAFVDGFGKGVGVGSGDFDAEDADDTFHAPSAFGILLLVFVPLLASALITAWRAKETT